MIIIYWCCFLLQGELIFLKVASLKVSTSGGARQIHLWVQNQKRKERKGVECNTWRLSIFEILL